MPTYKNIFFDLDDTLWAFSENARESFEEVYHAHRFDRFFDSFDSYYAIYQKRNLELWAEYAAGTITKAQLNATRFFYPLQVAGVNDASLAERFANDFFSLVPTKSKLMPYAAELLEYLAPKYNLYILSNGFRELQSHKMESGGIRHFFKRIILSEDIGVLKPNPLLFQFALSATQSELSSSIMIGDSWAADIVGARAVGMDHVYYNVEGREEFPFRPLYEVKGLREIVEIL